LTISALKTRKFFREVKDIESGEMGKLFNTSDDVVRAGLKVSDNPSEREEGFAAPGADILVWIKMPAGLKPEEQDFFCDVLPSGEQGAMAIYSVNGTNYSSIYKVLFTAKERNATLRTQGLCNQLWELKSEFKESTSFSWWQAALKPSAKVSADDAAYLKELI
jgi:hypothetical protein